MVKCPHCQSDKRQTKAALTRFGSHRFFYCACSLAYTPQAKPQGHPPSVRQEAVRYSLEGLSQRKVARLLQVAPQSVANWVAQAAAALQEQQVLDVPPEVAHHADGVMEQDEVYTFCNAKRTKRRQQAAPSAVALCDDHRQPPHALHRGVAGA